MTAGSWSFAAIGQWAADAGPDVLAALGAARGPAEESTFRRAFAQLSADTLDRLLEQGTEQRLRGVDAPVAVAVLRRLDREAPSWGIKGLFREFCGC